MMDSTFRGHNVGHASIALHFPADKEGERLIREYVEKHKIPYRKVVKKVPKVELVRDECGAIVKENGQPKTREVGVAYEEEKYVVHFSWFPLKEPPHYFLNTPEDDGYAERKGVDVGWSDKGGQEISERFGVEYDKRNARGVFGKSVITLGVHTSVHISSGIEPDLRDQLTKLAEAIQGLREANDAKYHITEDARTEANNLFQESSNLKTELSRIVMQFRAAKGKQIQDLSAERVEELALREANREDLKEKIQKADEAVNNHIVFRNPLELERCQREIDEVQAYLDEHNVDVARYISYGNPPDEVVRLGIKSRASEGEVGLNLESMLQKMADIAGIDDKATKKAGYDTMSKNCSATVMSIVQEGMDAEDKKKLSKGATLVNEAYKKTSSLIGATTPQTAYKQARTIRKNMSKQVLQIHQKEMNVFMKFIKSVKKLFSKKKISHKKSQQITHKRTQQKMAKSANLQLLTPAARQGIKSQFHDQTLAKLEELNTIFGTHNSAAYLAIKNFQGLIENAIYPVKAIDGLMKTVDKLDASALVKKIQKPTDDPVQMEADIQQKIDSVKTDLAQIQKVFVALEPAKAEGPRVSSSSKPR